MATAKKPASGAKGSSKEDPVVSPEAADSKNAPVPDPVEQVSPEQQVVPQQRTEDAEHPPNDDPAPQPEVEPTPDPGTVHPTPDDVKAAEADAPKERAESEEIEAMRQLEKLADEHPSLIAKMRRILGVGEAGPDDAKPASDPEPLHSKVSSLPINQFAVSNTDLGQVAKLTKVDPKMVMAWTCRGGVPDENMVIDDPQVYVSVVTRDGRHHVAPKPD